MNHDQFNDNQGRIGMSSTNASRAALGLPPLHRDAQEDESLYSMDDIEPVIWIVIAISTMVCVVGIASAIGMYLPF